MQHGLDHTRRMEDDHQHESTARGGAAIAERLTFAVTILTGVVLVCWVLWRCRAGFDFTDEGFYLVSVSRPWDFKSSFTLFGFVYHLLYLLVGGDIALLRQANVLVTLGLAWSLCVIVLQTQLPELGPAGRRPSLIAIGLAFVLSTSVLSHFDPWLPTPSYNSLALQALLLAGSGLLLAKGKGTRGSLAGWGLIGFSGWLAFMAKPTTALALAIVSGIYLLLAGKLRMKLLVVSLVTTLVFALISAWAIDGTVGGFVARLKLGVQDTSMLQSGHSMGEIWRLDNFSLGHGENTALVVMAFLVFLASLLRSSIRWVAQVGGAALVCVFSGTCIWIVTGHIFLQWASTPFRGMEFWAVPFGAWSVAPVLGHRDLARFISPGRLALVLCLVALPHVCTFGSNGNYWSWASRSAIFWVLAGIPLLGSDVGSKSSLCALLPMAAGAQAIAASLLFLSMEAPYRQPQPLRLDENTTCIGVPISRIRVSREVADYIHDLSRMARQGGFRVGDPMLDLTGHYPGALFALGAKPIGKPWMIGGYPGSNELAAASLDRVPREELCHAWVLIAPTDPRRLSLDILRRYGLDLARNYREVGIISSPQGEYPYEVEQRLFKPVGLAATPAR